MKSRTPADFLDLLERRDRAGVVQFVRALQDEGVSASDIILGFLAPAQRLVGEFWEAGLWSVSQEHAAWVSHREEALRQAARDR